MPGQSGLDVTRAVRADPAISGAHIVLLTAKGQAQDQEAGLAAGADQYLTKPFDPDALLAIARDGPRTRMSELRRLIVRHRHVAPMVSALLASIDAAVTIQDAEGGVILERGGPAGDHADLGAGRRSRSTATVLGWVAGGKAARGIAAVLAYAAARERDKRSLANEALERYRELSLIYDLAATIGGSDEVEPVVADGGRGAVAPAPRRARVPAAGARRRAGAGPRAPRTPAAP